VNREASADLDSIARELGVEKEMRDRDRQLIGLFLGRHPKRTPKPRVMAAAALYISSILVDRPISQNGVSRAAATTAATLRKWYKEMAAVLLPRGELSAACPRT